MKTIRYSFAAYVLASTLSISALAGTMHTGIAPEPEPTPATTEGEMATASNGDIQTTNGEEAAAGDSVVAGALSLVQSVLSLL